MTRIISWLEELATITLLRAKATIPSVVTLAMTLWSFSSQAVDQTMAMISIPVVMA
ncbi:hypothetical protein D3C77_633000 [compost metagenome]